MATGNVSNKYMAGTEGPMDQANEREVAVWFDQHRSSTYRDKNGEALFENGRPYHSIVEKRTRMPVGPVMPTGWEAPAYAPQQYVIKAIGRVTNLPSVALGGILTRTTTDRIKIDYAAMRYDDNLAYNAHWNEAVQKANAMGWTPPRRGEPMDPRLLALVGNAPRSPQIADAFIAGDPWLLGMLMPNRDGVIVENVKLARLLRLNRMDAVLEEDAAREDAFLEQQEQAAKAKAEVMQPDVVAEAKAMLDEAKRLHAEMKAMTEGKATRTDTAKRGPGRPPKAKTPEPAGTE